MKHLILLSTFFILNLYAIEIESLLKMKNENAFLTDDATLQKALLDTTLELDFSFDDDSKILIINRLRLDVKDKIEPDNFVNTNYSNHSKPITIGDVGQVEIREFYYEEISK